MERTGERMSLTVLSPLPCSADAIAHWVRYRRASFSTAITFFTAPLAGLAGKRVAAPAVTAWVPDLLPSVAQQTSSTKLCPTVHQLTPLIE
jgi:hypothetical protein